MIPQKFSIDLTKNKEFADLVADSEPSDKVYAKLSIVSKNDQTCEVELDTVGDSAKALDQPDEEDTEDDSNDEGSEEDDSGATTDDGSTPNSPFAGSSE